MIIHSKMAEALDLQSISENLDSTFWKEGRLETFEHWPFKSNKHKCNPENMATAGFYAVGGKDEPDLAQCFMCNKQLDGWEPDDDPWQEHKKHQPNCVFIKLDKPDESSLTIKELYELMLSYRRNIVKKDFDRSVESAKRAWHDAGSQIPSIYEAMKRSQKSAD